MLLESYAKRSTTSLPDVIHFKIWACELINATLIKLFLIGVLFRSQQFVDGVFFSEYDFD